MNSESLKDRRIAFFHQSADLYGSDKILLELAHFVQQMGGEPVVLLPETGPLTSELAARCIEFHVTPVLKVSRAHFSPAGLFKLFREWLSGRKAIDAIFRDRQVHLVHSNTIAVLAGALWAKRRRIPHLWHVHEIILHPPVASRLFPRFLSMWADKIVCNSQATYNWLIATRPSLANKSLVILNGVYGPERVDHTVVETLRRVFRPSGATLAIGLVGRINRWKGQLLLMDAADQLALRGLDNFSIVFVGSPPPSQEFLEVALRERIQQSPMRNRIHIQGYLQDIWSAYSALDVVCVPSIDPEPFGLVAVEAMIMSKPVVASRFGGLAEIVVHGETGLTFLPRNAGDLAAALEMLISSEDLRSAMGKAARLRYDAVFSAKKMLEPFGVLYGEMTA